MNPTRLPAMQIAFAFAGTDVFEKPASWRDLAESGLRNDIITDLEVRPIIFDEHDRERDQTWGGLIFGTALGTTDTDLQARFRPLPAAVHACHGAHCSCKLCLTRACSRIFVLTYKNL